MGWSRLSRWLVRRTHSGRFSDSGSRRLIRCNDVSASISPLSSGGGGPGGNCRTPGDAVRSHNRADISRHDWCWRDSVRGPAPQRGRMIRRVASQRRHLAVSQSSENFLLFSYGDYFEPGNVRWGGLRFFNDDLIHPACGFPLHFHDEIEVVTIVAAGGSASSTSSSRRCPSPVFREWCPSRGDERVLGTSPFVSDGDFSAGAG